MRRGTRPSTARRPSSTTTPSATSERAPMKQLSSMITGPAWSGSSTPPIPAPPEMDVAPDLRAAADRRPGVDHRPFADVRAEIDEARHQDRAGAMIAPRRTIAPGTARHSPCEAPPDPSRGTWTAPVPPWCAARPAGNRFHGVQAEAVSSTAFLSHWLTRHSPSTFSATRSSPRSSAEMLFRPLAGRGILGNRSHRAYPMRPRSSSCESVVIQCLQSCPQAIRRHRRW